MIPHPHDRKWYEEQLRALPAAYRQRAKEGYAMAYNEALEATAAPHRRENAARREANTRLRAYCEAVKNKLK